MRVTPSPPPFAPSFCFRSVTARFGAVSGSRTSTTRPGLLTGTMPSSAAERAGEAPSTVEQGRGKFAAHVLPSCLVAVTVVLVVVVVSVRACGGVVVCSVTPVTPRLYHCRRLYATCSVCPCLSVLSCLRCCLSRRSRSKRRNGRMMLSVCG